MERQPSRSVITPPSTMPTVKPSDSRVPLMPSARSRCGPSGKVVVSRDMPVGTMTAAPRPCSARPARNDRRVPGEGREQRGAAPKRASPVRNSSAPPVQVGDPAEEQQKAAGGQREGRDRPLQGGLAEPQVPAEIGQRHVQYGEVERDHELGGAQHEEDQPGAAGELRRSRRAREWGQRCRLPWSTPSGSRNSRGERELILLVGPPGRRTGGVRGRVGRARCDEGAPPR